MDKETARGDEEISGCVSETEEEVSLSIVYSTTREEPKIEWFLDSLKRQMGDVYIKLIIVDLHRNTRPLSLDGVPFETVWIEPKPNHFNGPHRLTKEDWFAASSYRNTGLCHASDGHVVFIDDLSVLLPTWMNAVRDMMKGNYVVCGAYRKVRNLVVESGDIKSWEPVIIEGQERGMDHRYGYGNDSRAEPCEGGWHYGCSCGGPVETYLNTDGWPEMADGISSEDYCLGIVLANNGVHLKYDRRMMTYESEELHHVGKVMIRRDKGKSPSDKSHALLGKVKGLKKFDNYFEGGIRQLRADTLAGKPFPPSRMPIRDWWDDQLISEFTP